MTRETLQHADLFAELADDIAGAPPCSLQPELDTWTRTTQRPYFRYLIQAIHEGTYLAVSLANVRYVMLHLNGLGGQW